MSWLGNIFKSNSSESLSNYVLLEDQIGIRLPGAFKKLIDKAYNETVIFRLYDADYHLLSSITNPTLNVSFDESLHQTFIEYNHQFTAGNDLKIVPFARCRVGDGYKYLFFKGKHGGECPDEIFMQDFDSPGTGSIRISENIGLLEGELVKQGSTSFIDCTKKRVSELLKYLRIPTEFPEYDDGKKTYRSTQINGEKESIKISLFASIGDFTNPKENFSLIHVYLNIEHRNKQYETYNSYELKYPKLKFPIERNNNHLIFYFKFLCILNELNNLKSNPHNNDKNEVSDLVDSLSAREIAKHALKSFEQIDYLTL